MIDWTKSAELNNCAVDELKARFERFPHSSKPIVSVCDYCGNPRESFFYQHRDVCRKCVWKVPGYRENASRIHIEFWKNNPEARDRVSKISNEYWADETRRNEQSARTSKQFADKYNREFNSLLLKKYYEEHPEAIDRMSATSKKYYEEHPNAAIIHSIKMKDHWGNQEKRDAQSTRLKKYYKDNPNALVEMSVALKKYHKEHPEVGEYHSAAMRNSDAAKANAEKMRGGNDIVLHHYIYDHSDATKYTMEVTRSKHMQIHIWMRKAGLFVPHINEVVVECT